MCKPKMMKIAPAILLRIVNRDIRYWPTALADAPSARSEEHTVRSYDNATNESALSGSASATTGAAPSWNDGDVGAVAAAGSFTDNGTALTITGSGADIWSTADEFHFAYRTLSGDGTMTARVTNLTNAHMWSKVGLMVRPSQDADAPYVDGMVHGDGLTSLQFRRTKGAITELVESPV